MRNDTGLRWCKETCHREGQVFPSEWVASHNALPKSLAWRGFTLDVRASRSFALLVQMLMAQFYAGTLQRIHRGNCAHCMYPGTIEDLLLCSLSRCCF